MRPSTDTGSLPRSMVHRTASERVLLRASSSTGATRRGPMAARARSQPTPLELDELGDAPQRRSRRRSLWGARAATEEDDDNPSSCLPAWRMSSTSTAPAVSPPDFDIPPPDAGLPPPRVRLNRLHSHELEESLVQRQFARLYAERRATAEQRARKATLRADEADDPAERVTGVPRATVPRATVPRATVPTATVPTAAPDGRRKRMSLRIRNAFVRVEDGASPTTQAPRALRYSMRVRARQRAVAAVNDMEARARRKESMRRTQGLEKSAALDEACKLTLKMQRDDSEMKHGVIRMQGDRALHRKDSTASSRDGGLGRKDSRRLLPGEDQSTASLPSLGRALRPPTAPVRRPSGLARGRSRQPTTLTASKLHAAELKRAAAVQAAQVAADARGAPRVHSVLSERTRGNERVHRMRSTSSAIFTASAIEVKSGNVNASEEETSGMFSDAEGDTGRGTEVRDRAPADAEKENVAPIKPIRNFVTAGPTSTPAKLRAACDAEMRTPNAKQMDVLKLKKATVGAPVSPAPRRFAPVKPNVTERQWGGSGRSKSLGLFAKRARGRVRSALGPMPPTHTPNVKGRWARRNVSEVDR